MHFSARGLLALVLVGLAFVGLVFVGLLFVRLALVALAFAESEHSFADPLEEAAVLAFAALVDLRWDCGL